ncbi:helix-turn-helix transcriptional regulator [Streptomyces formicae]
MRRAKDAMDRDWADPDLDLGAVAAHAGYSRYHFVRVFKEVYAETPGQYLSRRRIERAQDMLRSADLSVTEICVLVGFSSVGTFSSTFKRRTGMTPSEYRSRHVGRGAALIPGCYAMLWAGGFPARETGAGASPGRDAGMGTGSGTSGEDPGKGRNSEEAG